MLKLSRIAGSVSILITLFLVFGCGSGGKGGATSTVSGSTAAVHDSAVNFTNIPFTAAVPTESMLLSGAPKAGADACSNCHATAGSPIDAFTASLKKAAATDAGWINSPHANNNNSPSLSGLDASCKGCHDPVGDGSIIESTNAGGNSSLGTTNRPVVSCEACHGGGGNHFGLGPLPVATPNGLRCGRCHNGAMPDFHATANPEVVSIYEKYTTAKHSSSIQTANLVSGSKTDVQATCARCHTDEGAKAFVSVANGTSSYSEIKAALDSANPVKDASVVQCRTCHDKHNPGRLLGDKATGLPATWSSEFKTCTSCHQLLKADGTLQSQAFHAPYDSTGAAVNSTYGLSSGIITSTHFDSPTTTTIEGYNVNPAGDHDFCNGTSVSDGGVNKCGTCRDCHNPHAADATRNKQWARSAHAGGLLDVKEASIATDPKTLYSAAVGDTTGPAWAHYDFKGSSRADCQRCHTASGFRNLANNPSGYDSSQNVFVAASGTEQREMLYCWACHTSNTGNLRNPKQFVTPSSTTYIKPTDRDFPSDMGGSFICINCHSGRLTGQYVQNYSGSLATTFGSFNSHYLSAGAVMFRIEGFEFTGLDYSNPSYYAHDTIGRTAANTGTNGPCVGCHMQTPDSHLFLPVSRDSNNKITSVTSVVCKNCHTGTGAMTATLLNSEADGFAAAIAALKAVLQSKGIYYNSASYPYFFADAAFATQYKAWANKNTLGAAYNLNMLNREPGAYVHNRVYAKRLIFDSIDFLDNAAFDASVSTAINNSSLSADQKTAAIAYLGSTRP